MPSRRQSSATASRRWASNRIEPAPPPIAAIFLVRFDKRIGYNIAWSEAVAGLEIEGVEFKCLPSGLHNVQEDLVYFSHSHHVGLSIYRQTASTEAERNASFTALGVLVQRPSDGLGALWTHADPLRRLSESLNGASNDSAKVERYWKAHRVPDDLGGASPERPRSSGSLYKQGSSSFDPRQTLIPVLDEFGPLIFPIWRAALLRQRVLIIRQPPVRRSCETAYVLSLLATIPRRAGQHLPQSSPTHITPAFSLGIHDIPELENDAASSVKGEPVRPVLSEDGQLMASGWIACTSDKLLESKNKLSDIRISIKEETGTTSAAHLWPDAVRADGTKVLATQRDLRRYVALRQSTMSMQAEDTVDSDDEQYDSVDDSVNLIRKKSARDFEVNVKNESSIVEPQSWAMTVYDGYYWWASAGERASELQDEYDNDADLRLDSADFEEDDSPYKRRRSISGRPSTPRDFADSASSTLVAYFHHFNSQIINTLSQVVEAAGDEEPQQRVVVSKDDLSAMGLDPWSANDRTWVAKMLKLYFRRDAEVEGGSIECCGVKLY